MAYAPQVIERFKSSTDLSNQNVGSLDKDAKNVGTGIVGAPACGDVMKFRIKVRADGTIEEAKFKTFGCGSAIASSALAVEWVKGKTLDEALTITNSGIATHLSLPPVKLHCSVLAEGAIRAAIDDYKSKQGLGTSGESTEETATSEYKKQKMSDSLNAEVEE